MNKSDKKMTKEELLKELSKLRKEIKKLNKLASEHELLVTALKESENKYSSLIENSKDGIVIIQNAIFKFVNAVSLEFIGYNKEELIGKSFLETVNPKFHQLIKQRYDDRIGGKAVPSVYEIEVMAKDGRIIPVEVSSSIIDYEGSPADLVFIRDLTERKRAKKDLQRAYDELEMRVRERTEELAKANLRLVDEVKERELAEDKLLKSYIKLKHIFYNTVQAIGTIVETRDPYTAGHQKRVAKLSVAIAMAMELDEDRRECIQIAAGVHDIGKINVPAEILSKPGKLSEPELIIIRSHCLVGYNILKEIEFPWLVANIIMQHHERIDGSGYPNGLKGDDILLEAKIICVADVVEAMSSHRPYRPAIGIKQAIEEISNNRGILYDSEVVDACIKVITSENFKFQ